MPLPRQNKTKSKVTLLNRKVFTITSWGKMMRWWWLRSHGLGFSPYITDDQKQGRVTLENHSSLWPSISSSVPDDVGFYLEFSDSFVYEFVYGGRGGGERCQLEHPEGFWFFFPPLIVSQGEKIVLKKKKSMQVNYLGWKGSRGPWSSGNWTSTYLL